LTPEKPAKFFQNVFTFSTVLSHKLWISIWKGRVLAKKRKLKINYELEYYAAFDWRGNILDATIKRTKTESVEALKRFNPPVAGHPYDYEVLPIMIGIDTRQSQQELFKDI